MTRENITVDTGMNTEALDAQNRSAESVILHDGKFGQGVGKA